MRAVVARRGQLLCEDIAELAPGPGQVLVKTLSCGICGSDLHALHHLDRMVDLGRRVDDVVFGGLDAGQDLVFGHEFSAEILDHGPGSPRSLKVGTRVVSMPFLSGSAGPIVIGYSNLFPGGYAERMLLQEAALIPIPNGLSDSHAALTEPFAIGTHAVAQAALDEPGAALVVGCGPVGLAVVAALKGRGYGPVIAADFSPARRRLAERLGADIVVDPALESPHGKWRDVGVLTGMERTMAHTGGDPTKRAIIFECVGVPGVLQGLLEAAPKGSQIIVLGVCMEPDLFEPFMAVSKEIDFRFVQGYSPAEFSGTLNDISEGRIDVAPLITDTVGLDGVAGAFAALADPESQVKIIVKPGA